MGLWVWRRCAPPPGSQESLRKPSRSSTRGIYSPPRSHTVHISESEVSFFIFHTSFNGNLNYFSQLFHCNEVLLNQTWIHCLSAKVLIPGASREAVIQFLAGPMPKIPYPKTNRPPPNKSPHLNKSPPQPPSCLDQAQCLCYGHKAGCDMKICQSDA